MRNLKSQIVIFGFYGFLALAVLAHFIKLDTAVTAMDTKARAEFPKPTEGISKFPTKLEQWYLQNFPFRNFLLKTASNIRNFMFHTPSSDSVLFGKENHLFFTGQNNIEGYRNLIPLSDTEINEALDRLEARTQELSKKSILYVVVVSPNPQTIYPEHLPEWVVKVGSQSRLDQLLSAAQKRKNVAFLDLRPALIAAKPHGLLYFKTDTHWNDLGAFFAYQSILTSLYELLPNLPERSDLKPLSYEDYSVEVHPLKGGDLANMLNAATTLKEEAPHLEKKVPSRVKITENLDARFTDLRKQIIESGGFTAEQSKNYTTSNPDISPKLRALVFRDSYFTSVTQYFSENFHSVKYIWNDGHFEPTEIDKFKPTIVIQEVVERSLSSHL